MFGCLRRIGCLIVLLAGALAAYTWYKHHAPHTVAALTASHGWTFVTGADAARGAQKVNQLRSNSGRVFVNLTGAEAVGYLIQTVAKELPPSSEDVQAMVNGDTLRVRAIIPLRSLGGGKVLGPLASLLGDRDSVQLSGTADVIRPGLAQFRVTEITIHNFALPSPVIPKLVAQLRHQSPAGLAPNGLALPLPPYVGDIRVANGKVTLYKNV